MFKWLRRLCRWIKVFVCPCTPIVEVCDKDHVDHHQCWDDIWFQTDGFVLPGPKSWFCSKCGRLWNTPQDRETEVGKGYENYQLGLGTMAEYDTTDKKLTVFNPGKFCLVEARRLGRKKRNDTG